MLKNINFGLAALVLGFGLVVTQSAFTPDSATGKREKLTFHYQGPQPMTESDVEDESNWVYGEDECIEGSALACSIQIERTYVNNPDGPATPTLKTTANLAAPSAPSAPILTGSADSFNVILNRAAD